MMKEKNFVSAVVYLHNAKDQAEHFARSLATFFEDNFEHSEIIFVNDDSTDGSDDVIRKVSKEVRKTTVSLINLSYFHGLEVAMTAGLDFSIGDFVFEFDHVYMDYEMDDVFAAYRRVLEGYDIVSASPDRKERLSSRIFYALYARFATHTTERMHTETFRVLSRRVINRITQMNKTVPYRKAVYAGSGLKTDHMIYSVRPDSTRPAHLREERQNRADVAVDSILLFTDLGYRFSMFMSFVMLVMMIAVIVYTLAAYLVSNPVSGWTSTILFLSVAFFGLFLILTVVIKYLQLLLRLVFKRQQYSFESIEKLTK